eukprot:s415_g8.t1
MPPTPRATFQKRGNDSEAACIEGAGLGITLLLGLASALVSDLMIYGLVSLRRQNFKSAHGNVELQLKVKEWRVLIVSVYVIMAFFATVTPTDTETWAAGALVVLLEEFFFGPLLLAGAYSLLVTHTLEDAAIGQSMRMAAGAVQAPFRAWDGPSAADFRVPIPHEASAQGGQLRALGAAPHEDLGVQSLTLGEDQQQHGGAEVALQSREMEEQRRLQEQLREQLETQKKQLEQQQQMQVELRQQLQRQQQEMEAERRQRHRSPPPERPPARFQQQAWQQDNRSQVQQAPTALPLPGAVHLNTPPLPQIVTRPTQQVSSVNLGLQRAVRHGAVVRSGRPGPPSWPPPALRDTGRFGAGAPPQPDVKAAEKNPPEASAREAEDAAPGPKKKQKSELFKAPEAAEVVEIARTRNLYKSNLFRLQLEELVKEMTPKKPPPGLEAALHALRPLLLEKLRARDIPADFAQEFPALRFAQRGGAAPSALRFTAPRRIDVVGSFLLGTYTKEELTVDVAVEMPSDMFRSKERVDYLNFRYHDKRAAYLAELHRQLCGGLLRGYRSLMLNPRAVNSKYHASSAAPS